MGRAWWSIDGQLRIWCLLCGKWISRFVSLHAFHHIIRLRFTIAQRPRRHNDTIAQELFS